MNDRGFSLVEMIVVIGIMATLLSIATLQFNRMTTKYNIEAQTKMLHGDLMKVRAEALLQKRSRAVNFVSTTTQTTFSIFSSVDTGAGAVAQNKLKYRMAPGGTTIINFDRMGMASSSSFNVSVDPPILTVCTSPSDNPSALDSIIITPTRIGVGKRQTGQGCTYDKVDQK
jgi:prepilin-type N-terminal cleavage/methylation domain-containing protein